MFGILCILCIYRHSENGSVGFTSLPYGTKKVRIPVLEDVSIVVWTALSERGGLSFQTSYNPDLCFFRPSSFVSYHIPLYPVLWPSTAACGPLNRLSFYFKPPSPLPNSKVLFQFTSVQPSLPCTSFACFSIICLFLLCLLVVSA